MAAGMPGNYGPDPDLCKYYAKFASHMSTWKFQVIYWVLFVLNLAVLFISSWVYTRCQRAQENYGPRRARSIRTCIFICLSCAAISTVLVVMEAFALLAVQFCDGEPLMPLFWSTWAMVQLGSLIAIVGTILALLHYLRDSKHPPWALALGTPVLVIAGFLHLFHECTKTRIKRARQRRRLDGIDLSQSISQANTIQASQGDYSNEDEGAQQAELIGFTVAGGLIVRFASPLRGSAADKGTVIGHGSCERPIVTFEKDTIEFVSAKELSDETNNRSR